MRRIAVSLSKGGVGKTTTAVNLSAGLATAGHSVLLIDTDTQGQCSRGLGIQPREGLAGLVTGSVGAEGALTEARPNLWLLAGGRQLAGVKREIGRKDFGGEQTLSEVLGVYEGRYDFVILDTAPGWDVLTVNVLFYAAEILAPVALEALAIQGLLEFGQNLAAIQRYHPDLSLRYILPTFYDRRTRQSDEILGQLKARYGALLCDPIRYNVRLSEAPGHGQTILEYAPASPGAADYQQLTERILNDEQA